MVAAVFIAAAVPYCWHESGYDQDGSTDYLAYIGALLGAVATIVAVGWQIRSEANARKEEYEQATRPVIWLGIDPGFQRRTGSHSDLYEGNHDSLLQQQQENLAIDHDYDVKTYGTCLILAKEGDTIVRTSHIEISESMSLNAHHSFCHHKYEGGSVASGYGKFYPVPLIVKNVGAGPALNLIIGTMLPGEDLGYRDNEPPAVLGVNDITYFLILLERSDWKPNETFYVTATYDTLTGQCYRTSNEVTVIVDEKNQLVSTTRFKTVQNTVLVELDTSDSWD